MMAAIWICLCGYFNCVGWRLYVLHALNRTGYAIAFALGTCGLMIWRARAGRDFFPSINWRKLALCFRQPFPAGFLFCSLGLLSTSAFAGTPEVTNYWELELNSSSDSSPALGNDGT